MFDMQVWQLAAVAIVAIVSLAWMSRAIVRLTFSPASGKGTVREATAIESALVGGVVPEGAQVFDGWAYRVGARFAGRVRIAVYSDRVAVAGPRVPRGLYQVWVWVQGLLLALVIPALVAAVVLLDWRWLVAAIGLFITSYGISFAGAGLWPGLGEILYDQGHPETLEFPRASISEVDIGKGWAKGGFDVVLFPYKAFIDRMSEGLAVSFFAPDEHGKQVRFAIDLYTNEYARELVEVLASEGADPAA
jgi:hypothetical protein